MSDRFEPGMQDQLPDSVENSSITLKDALILISENSDDIIKLKQNYSELLKIIIQIQSGIASIERRIPRDITIKASRDIKELNDSIQDKTSSILEEFI